MQEVQDFITAGLLSDEAWSHALNLGFDLPKVELSPAERLRKAINEGMAEESAEIAAIIANTASPTFANTIEALERSGRKLERATTLMYNLLSAETSDELNNLANEIAPVLSDHGNDIMLNPALFARVKAVYDESPSLEAEERMLLDKTYESFERAGATLSEEDKRKFREITGTLSSETLKFSQNLLKDTNAFILHLTDEAELDGLPAIHREAARSEAAARNLEGWVVTLQSPSLAPL